ncbi:NmrA family NAD(P)-binding protein [Gordonia sp. NPDC003429]
MNADTALVVGASGSATGHVVTSLAGAGVRVRGLVRDAGRADLARTRGATEIAVGDLTDPDSLRAALDGVDAVFYIAPAFIDDEADLGVRMVDLATSAGVGRFVFSSVIHPTLDLVNHSAKAPVERALYDSGMEYVVFQPALFFQNLTAGFPRAAATGVFAEPWSVTTRFSRIDYRDIADAVALAMTGDRLLGGTYEMATDGQLDRNDLADLMSRASGRAIRAERLDPDDLPDVSPPMRAMFAHYDTAGLISTAVTATAVLERAPRTLSAFFTELSTSTNGR